MSEESEAKLANFQAICDMRNSEGEQIWSSFNILVVANAIVLGIIGTVLASTRLTNPSSPVLIAASLFGMALTVLWWRFAGRGLKYMDIMVGNHQGV